LREAGRERADYHVLTTVSRRRHLADADVLEHAGVDAIAVPVALIGQDPDLDARIDAVRRFAAERPGRP